MYRLLPLSIIVSCLAACGPDPADACAEAYAHLTAIAKRRPNPELSAQFITSCIEVADLQRVECLRAATTPGEALACKPMKKRPG